MIDLFEELRMVTQVLDQNGIPYALAGGLAYSIWVEARSTEDIDLMIYPEDWEKIIAAMASIGYQEISAQMDFASIRIRRLTKIQDADFLLLDFLLADGDLRKGIEQAVRLTQNDRIYCVAPPEVIIQMKQNRMSSKDRNDIEGLQKLLGQSPS